MAKIKGASYVVLLTFFSFLLSGCTAQEAGQNLENIDKKVGEMIKNFQEQEEASDPAGKEQSGEAKEENQEPIAGSLTGEQKQDIDSWLEENGYNRYGDSRNAIYTGGTPLYNEETGESIGRYEYILKKFPNILDRVE